MENKRQTSIEEQYSQKMIPTSQRKHVLCASVYIGRQCLHAAWPAVDIWANHVTGHNINDFRPYSLVSDVLYSTWKNRG